MGKIINSILVSTLWVMPVVAASCLLDQSVPQYRKNESFLKTYFLIIFQVVAAFFLFEGLEQLIPLVNQKILNFVQIPELVSGSIILGMVQSKTQKTLSKRIDSVYGSIDEGLGSIGIGSN